jgi:hypothetical protein
VAAGARPVNDQFAVAEDKRSLVTELEGTKVMETFAKLGMPEQQAKNGQGFDAGSFWHPPFQHDGMLLVQRQLEGSYAHCHLTLIRSSMLHKL